MGMFDKDKQYGGDPLWIRDGVKYVELEEVFALYGAEVVAEDVPTKMGTAMKTELTVGKVKSSAKGFVADPKSEKVKVVTFASAIADKAKEADPSDFPCAVKLQIVKAAEEKGGGDALVLSYVDQLN